MASIEPRSGKWRVYWRLGSKKQSATFSTEKNALKAKRLVEAHGHKVDKWFVYNAVLGTPIPTVARPATVSPTLREWVDVWLDSKTRITPSTALTYRRQFDREILPDLGDMRLTEIDGVHVSRLINRLRTKLADNTVTRYYSALHACLEFAVAEKKIPDNPAKRTDFIRDVIAFDDTRDDGEGHVYLNPAEYQMILDAAAPDARPLIEFLAGTGCRFSEATAVSVDAFDALADPPGVRIHRAWKHDGKGGWYLGSTKGRNRRTVTIGRQVVDAVLPLVAGEPGDTLIFRSPEGNRIAYGNFRNRRWEPAVIAAMRCAVHPPARRGREVAAAELAGPLCGDNGGVRDDGKPCGANLVDGWDRCRTHREPTRDTMSTCDCPTRLRRRPTLHDLRHSHVALLIAAGRPLPAISRRIGHKTTAITESVYAGILPEVDLSMADAVDAALRRAAPAAPAVPAAGR